MSKPGEFEALLGVATTARERARNELERAIYAARIAREDELGRGARRPWTGEDIAAACRAAAEAYIDFFLGGGAPPGEVAAGKVEAAPAKKRGK